MNILDELTKLVVRDPKELAKIRAYRAWKRLGVRIPSVNHETYRPRFDRENPQYGVTNWKPTGLSIKFLADGRVAANGNYKPVVQDSVMVFLYYSEKQDGYWGAEETVEVVRDMKLGGQSVEVRLYFEKGCGPTMWISYDNGGSLFEGENLTIGEVIRRDPGLQQYLSAFSGEIDMAATVREISRLDNDGVLPLVIKPA